MNSTQKLTSITTEARYYDAAVGRFLSEDPIGFDGGDANYYRYVGNSPTTATDPTGKIAWIPIVIGVCRVASAAYDAYDSYNTLTDPDASGLEKAYVIGSAVSGTRGVSRVVDRVADSVKALRKAPKRKVEVKTRSTPGTDNATSHHLIEKVDDQTISVTHQVIKDGTVIHQHQTHIGNYGAHRRFPDEWVEYRTIPLGE